MVSIKKTKIGVVGEAGRVLLLRQERWGHTCDGLCGLLLMNPFCFWCCRNSFRASQSMVLTSSISLSWELVRNAGSQTPPQTSWFTIFVGGTQQSAFRSPSRRFQHMEKLRNSPLQFSCCLLFLLQKGRSKFSSLFMKIKPLYNPVHQVVQDMHTVFTNSLRVY